MLRRVPERSELWLVDPVTKVANEFSSTPSTLDAARRAIFSPADIAMLARWLRQRGLTTSLVQHILDRANIHAAYRQETNDILDGYAPMDEVYMRLRVPTPIQSSALTTRPLPSAITFECVSRDQGGIAELHQSPLRCHRWLEFEILDTNQLVVLPRQDVCRMFRSCRDYRCHVLTVDDPQVLQHLCSGHQVVLHVRADKKGSSNYAKYASISLHYSAELTVVDQVSSAQDTCKSSATFQPPIATSKSPTSAGDINAPSSPPVDHPKPCVVGAIEIAAVAVGLKDNWETVESPAKPVPSFAMTEEWIDVAPTRPAKPKDRGTAAAVAPSPHDISQAPTATKHPDEKCVIS